MGFIYEDLTFRPPSRNFCSFFWTAIMAS